MTDPQPPENARAAFLGAGATLAHYRLERELGRGGQGTVFLAEDLRLKRKVALKLLTAFGPGSEAPVERFRREAEVASRLDHPGICGVYDAGVAEGVPYIAMHYVEGRTLSDVIAAARGATSPDGGPTVWDLGSGLTLAETSEPKPRPAPRPSDAPRPTADETLFIFERAARALHAAHEAGVIHRDIKPGNIMLDRDGAPVILDFGLAHAEDSDLRTLTRTGDLFGTPAYMSPEQLTGQRIRLDRRTDVYSLGVALFECLTLKRPFEAPTRQALYQAVLTKSPPDPRRFEPKLSSDVKVVLETALEKDRDRRYQSAADLAEDLRRVRANEPILARPVGPLGKLWRWSRREPSKAALLGVVLVTLPAIAVLVTAHWKDRPALEQARAAALYREQEALLAEASWEFSEGSPAAAARLFDRLLASENPPAEAVVGRASLHLRLREPESALRVLDAHAECDGHAAVRLRVEALDQLGRRAEAEALAKATPPPRTAVDFAALALFALHEGERTQETARFREALSHATRAALLAPAPRLDYYVIRAHAAAHVRDVAACAETASALRRHWPSSANANFFVGFALEAVPSPRGRAEVAAAYRAALAARPDFHAARFNLANALIDDDEGERAVQVLREAVGLAPEDFDFRVALARALHRAGRKEEADAAFREAIRTAPETGDAQARLAAGLRDVGRLEDALAAIRRALVHSPNQPDYHLCHGEALLDLNRSDEAVAPLEAARRLNPERSGLLHLLGLAYANRGDHAKAEECFRSAIAADPKDAESRANLAAIFVQRGDGEGALKLLDEAALKASESHPEVLGRIQRERARLLLFARRLDDALRAIDEAVRRIPADGEVHFIRGELLRAQARYEEAAAAFAESARLRPEHPESRCNLGLCLRRAGRVAEAVDALRAGHALGTRSESWRYPSADWLAEAERALGDANDPAPELEGHLRAGTAPAAASDEARLARVLHARGRHEDAVRWFERAFARDPETEDDYESRNRFKAAAAALEAAAKTADVQVAAALRKQAAAWLAADVEALDEAEISRSAMRRRLVDYVNEPALAHLRNGGLAKLPEDQRALLEPPIRRLDELETGR